MAKDENTILDSEETALDSDETVLDAEAADATLPDDDAATLPDDTTALDGEATSNVRSSGSIIEKGASLLDTYRIESDAIEGGMGAVWRVHHTGWNVDLAMKRPKACLFQSEKQKENFVHECEAWINLGLHPHIVSCYYVRDIAGVPSIFSEWMDGGSLKNAIEDGRLYEGKAAERILDIAIQFARGLHYAQEQGLIHQDVKPDNLLLTKDWDAKVADFGIARARATLTVLDADIPDDTTILSASGGYTPAYCSMEQMNGEQLTRRTDIYSWAVSVMEMYLEERPWQNGVIAGAACEEYFPDAKIAIPQKMQELLKKCLNAEETQRPHDFAEVEKRLLEIYLEETKKEYPRPVSKAAADTADSLNNRALSYIDLGKYDEARQIFLDILTGIDTSHMEASFNAQLLDFFCGRVQAVELIRNLELMDRQRSTWRTAYYVGLGRSMVGDSRAVVDLERAHAASGGNADVAAALERAKSDAECLPDVTAIITPRNAMPWQITRIASTAAYIRRMRNIAEIDETVEQYLAFLGPDAATEYLNTVAPKITGFDNSEEYEKINDNISKYGVPGKPHAHMSAGMAESLAGMSATACCMDLTNICLMSGSQNGAVAVFALDNAAAMELPIHTGEVSALSMSGTGQIAAVASGTETDGYCISFWNLKQQKSLGRSEPFRKRINGLQFSLKDSMYIALGDDCGDTYIWKAGDSSYIKKIRGAAHPRFNENGDILVFDGKRLVLISIPACKTLLRFDRIRKSSPLAIDISPDGRLAASASDGEITFWDDKGRVKGTIPAGSNPITALCFCSDNRHIYSGDDKGMIRLWNADTLTGEWDFCEHSGAVTSLCSSADMRYMASTAKDGRMLLRKLIWNYQKRPPRI